MKLLATIFILSVVFFSLSLVVSCSKGSTEIVKDDIMREQNHSSVLVDRQNSASPAIGWWVK